MPPEPDLRLLDWERYPRASRYDPRWVLDNEMGPHALWLLEELLDGVALEPGWRVLDMGCGRGLTSVYLAREHGVQVWANDLWIGATENAVRFREAGVADRVFPIHAEAHALPYAHGFFDAIVSVDSYHYYGTDELYLRYVTRFLRPGGTLAFIAPGLVRELDGDVPEHLARRQASGATFWDPAECWSFHSADWWRRHLAKTGLVEVAESRLLEDGWRLWLRWERARAGGGHTGFPSDAEALEADAGRTIGFVKVVARAR